MSALAVLLIAVGWFGGIWWMIERSRFRIDHPSDVKALKWFYGMYVPTWYVALIILLVFGR